MARKKVSREIGRPVAMSPFGDVWTHIMASLTRALRHIKAREYSDAERCIDRAIALKKPGAESSWSDDQDWKESQLVLELYRAALATGRQKLASRVAAYSRIV